MSIVMRLFTFFMIVSTIGFAKQKENISYSFWDVKEWSKAPSYKSLPAVGNVEALLFKSIDYKGKTTEVFAWYANPEMLSGKISSSKKYPAIVLVHGGGGKAYKEWVELWAAKGYAAIAIDLSGNGLDGKKLKFSGPEQTDENKFQKIEEGNIKDVWSYHAVASVILSHSLLLSFPEVDTTKTCITGISWGGYITCIAASLDKRFKAAAPVYGCAYFDESDVFGNNLKQLKAVYRELWLDSFDASNFLPDAKCKFLFINGNKDRVFNIIPYDKTYRLISEYQRTVIIKPDMGHSHPSGWASDEIGYFFEHVLQGKSPLPKIIMKIKRGNKASLIYSSAADLLSAKFYYSTDTVSTNEKRVWKNKDVVINTTQKKITCNVPEKFKYGFFYIKDISGNAVSGELFIN